MPCPNFFIGFGYGGFDASFGKGGFTFDGGFGAGAPGGWFLYYEVYTQFSVFKHVRVLAVLCPCCIHQFFKL